MTEIVAQQYNEHLSDMGYFRDKPIWVTDLCIEERGTDKIELGKQLLRLDPDSEDYHVKVSEVCEKHEGLWLDWVQTLRNLRDDYYQALLRDNLPDIWRPMYRFDPRVVTRSVSSIRLKRMGQLRRISRLKRRLGNREIPYGSNIRVEVSGSSCICNRCTTDVRNDMKMKIQTSQDSFRDLIESGSYYIDKTEIIREYLEEHFEKAVMFARPRRFGKSLTMTMFRDFLDIRQDSKEIFEGLKIMNYPDLIKEYMNQYPVVFLSLKEVFGEGFDSIYRNFQNIISTLCKGWDILLSSEKVNRYDKVLLEKLMQRDSKQEDTIEALDLLSRMLCAHYQKPVFVFIDEYDVPMAKAYGTPAYDKVRDMIEHMLSYVCKTNSNVKGVILSGCLYTVKNSTYTGVNNIIPYTVLSPLYASAIGFTDENVRKLLNDAGLTDLYETVEEWYDGYIFGRERMYCPWDVLCFVKSKLDGTYDEDRGPESYWLNTSATSLNLIHGFLGKSAGANEGFEQLLAGGTLDCSVNEYVPYHQIHENGVNLWSALVETGYLTKAVPGRPPRMPLRIPNRSIQLVFRQEVWNYFNDKVDNIFVRDLVNALWAREIQKAEDSLNQILEATLSFYHEYHEYSYHLILDGFFTGLGYRVQSERETGYGRSDLIILDPARQRCLILELKHVKEDSGMKAALQEAESQIIKKKYESQLIYEGYTTWIQYGMAFCDKRTLITKVH